MTDLFQEPEDATPLDPDERDGLLQSWITTRADLNVAEQDSIDAGAAWAFRQRRRDIPTVGFATSLHKRMFGDVWDWAGTYRQTERNIGIEPAHIAQEMALLFNDVRYWVSHETYPPDEIAVRLHHRLVFIHPFPNGNGRHARMMADLLIRRLSGQPFTWGGGSLVDIEELRKSYIEALREADGHNIEPLLAFARS
ncbi:MAG: mobile mystery protein B [Geminicoccaceae bacterium]